MVKNFRSRLVAGAILGCVSQVSLASPALANCALVGTTLKCTVSDDDITLKPGTEPRLTAAK